MKKIFLVVLITVFASSVFAQDTAAVKAPATAPAPTPAAAPNKTDEPVFHFGFKFAPNLAWFKTDSPGLTSDGSKFGFTYGLITEFRFAPNYAFATGIDVTYRGGNFKSSRSDTAGGVTTTTNSEGSLNLEYIEIPLTLKLKTNEIGNFVYFVQFGVGPAFNIRARQDSKVTTQVGTAPPTAKETTNIDVQDDINAFNLSMIIAAGLEYKLSGNTVMLAALNFDNGFLDVLDSPDYKANNNYLGLTLGVLF